MERKGKKMEKKSYQLAGNEYPSPLDPFYYAKSAPPRSHRAFSGRAQIFTTFPPCTRACLFAGKLGLATVFVWETTPPGVAILKFLKLFNLSAVVKY